MVDGYSDSRQFIMLKIKGVTNIFGGVNILGVSLEDTVHVRIICVGGGLHV